jgi:hypothetical protein
LPTRWKQREGGLEMGIRIRSGMIGLCALLSAIGQAKSAAAQNGYNLTEFQRSQGGIIENYYTAGDDNLAFGLATADEAFRAKVVIPQVARDALDAVVPIQLKRWNSNAAKEMMRLITYDYFCGKPEPYCDAPANTDLVPTRYNDIDKLSLQKKAGTANLRHLDYVRQMLEWTNDPDFLSPAQALTEGFIQYFTPPSGEGFLNNIKVGDGTVAERVDGTPPEELLKPPQILAVNWGLALRGMGGLARQFNEPFYWTWAAARLRFVWDHRAQADGNPLPLFADVYDSEGWTTPSPGGDNTPPVIAEVVNLADTDTLYLLRAAYEGARLGSDDAIASTYLEPVARHWYNWGRTHNQSGINDHGVRKMSRSTGTPMDSRIYSDGKQNYFYALSILYRLTGDPTIITRLEELWETFRVVGYPTGLIAYGINGSSGYGESALGYYWMEEQPAVLDALVDAYLATGSTTLLDAAETLAAAIQNPPAGEEPLKTRDGTADPFFRLAEATHGEIARLEVNLGTKLGQVKIQTSTGVLVAPPWQLPNESAVIFLPQGTYRVELTPAGGAARAVTLPVTRAGARIDYQSGNPVGNLLTGFIVQDNNDNGIQDDVDSPASGARVFIDSMANYRFDSGETNQIAGPNGSYVLSAPPGACRLRAEKLTGRWTSHTDNWGGTAGSTITFHTAGLTVAPASFAFTTKKRISGRVFHDLNGNMFKGSTEKYLTESIVYFDTNNNGVRNLGEPFAATDTKGAYSIGNLPAGGSLRLVRRSAVPSVTKPTTGFYSVAFGSSAEHREDVDFGIR